MIEINIEEIDDNYVVTVCGGLTPDGQTTHSKWKEVQDRVAEILEGEKKPLDPFQSKITDHCVGEDE